MEKSRQNCHKGNTFCDIFALPSIQLLIVLNTIHVLSNGELQSK